MNPALGLLQNALKGEEGALSVLERTATIYVYDGTNPQEPKTCGAWDFINEALNEVERYESRMLSGTNQETHPVMKLEDHIQLLAKMSRRASRRTPKVDERLVTICLENAHNYGSSHQAHFLIDSNNKMRQRVMGRIAAIVFDFSNYSTVPSNQPEQYNSAFRNPVVMENFCAIVAANTISSGPTEFFNLVSQWIIPSLRELPSLAVATITYYLASESSQKSVPSGTNELKNNLFESIVTKIISPILLDYVTNSNVDKKKNHVNFQQNERIITISLRALARWSKETNSSITHIKKVCTLSNIDVIKMISNVLHSESGMILEALEELFNELFGESIDIHSLQGMRIVGQYASLHSLVGTQSECLQHLENEAASGLKEHEIIVSEISSAIAQQRSRFNEAIANGDDKICLCLVSMARSVAESLPLLSNSLELNNVANDLVDFLLGTTSHPSIHVCGIALDAIHPLLGVQHDLSIKLLPILQGRAIIPPCLVNLPSKVSCNADMQEFERFRKFSLAETLMACYQSNESYYIKSCSSAVDEFCSAPSSPQLPYQLEAALFCINAVSVDASKRAALALHDETNMVTEHEIDNGLFDIHQGLEKCARSLTANPKIVSSSPLSITQASHFFAKYAIWLSKSNTKDILDAAMSLVLSLFSQLTSHPPATFHVENSSACASEVATAIKTIVSSLPEHFATIEFLSSMESIWKRLCINQNSPEIGMDERRITGCAICQIISVLPPEKWIESLTNLTNPAFELIGKFAEESVTLDDTVTSENQVSKLSDEISLVASILRDFHDAIDRRNILLSFEKEKSILSILQNCWRFINHIIDKGHCVYENLSMAVSETFSVAAVSVEIVNNVESFTDVFELACKMMDICIQKSKLDSTVPILSFVNCVIDTHGSKIESGEDAVDISISRRNIQEMGKRLICHVFESVYTIASQGKNGNSQTESIPRLGDAEKASLLYTSLFSIGCACVKECPNLFFNQRISHEDQDSALFAPAVELAKSSLNGKDIDASKAAMKFLTKVFHFRTENEKNSVVVSRIDRSISILRTELITSLLCGACGICPRDSLESAAGLLYSVLTCTTSDKAGPAAISAVQRDTFILGDQGRNTTILTLGKCAQGTKSQSVLTDLFQDLWQLHQIDDTGNNLVGGDSVESFCKKYGSSSN